MPHQPDESTPSLPRLWLAQLAALVVGLAIVYAGDAPRIRTAIASGTPLSWLADMNVETTPYLLIFIVLPLFWCVRRPLFGSRPGAIRRFLAGLLNSETEHDTPGLREWMLALFVASASIGVSVWVAQRPVNSQTANTIGELPPAFHDEFSYLFQAKTFLAGRLSYPSHPGAPELFDQVHVLNDDGRYASRFFPGTGLWMAPFVAMGNPYWGHWFAGGLTAFFFFWAGRELGGNGVGLLAGVLVAMSPGMAHFSNLLLAHHPGLAALSLFLFSFLRLMRSRRWYWAVAAGSGLGFAMLCRPMTAAGFGLPFGIWFAWWLIRGDKTDDSAVARGRSDIASRIRMAIALSLPIVAAFTFLAINNRATTGSAWTTAYQRYTDIYTPRHVYGFNNVLRGEQKLGPKVLENYDRWTENLAPRIWERDENGNIRPSLASQNVMNRLQYSLTWSLALVPLSMAAVLFLFGGVARSDSRWWMIAAAILSLHIAHIPYWYDGIMHWHYVFETGPLWLLLFAGVTIHFGRYWRATNHPLMPLWWALLIVAALLTNYTSPDLFWNNSKIEAAVQEVAFARQKHAAIQQLIETRVTQRPAIVLIESDPADRHVDYVTDEPSLTAEVLRGRFQPGKTDPAKVAAKFPGRAVYLYRAATRELKLLYSPESR